ncbi:MAG TPA: diiron oxygenase, partial [Acidimicrobiales bacterium]|nr:diiron oxygenase [Acidimicrobiales bacterium]
MTVTTEITDVPTAPVDDRQGWDALLARLSRQSVVKHFDAYADVAWDEPDMAIDRTDPRWELGADDPLGGTAWYQALPQETRAGLGLDLVASKMKIGLQFEAILK